MRVKDVKRLNEMLEWINQEGYASVEQLSQHFGVSLATVRRDLLDLEKSDGVYRTHGGVYAQTLKLLNSVTRDQINHAEKSAIARKAVESLKPGDTIFLDPGSSIEQLALQIRETFNHEPLTVITSGHRAFLHLFELPEIHLILLGGHYYPETQSFAGPITMRAVSELMIDKYFMATIGIVPRFGLTDSSEADCEVKRQVLERAQEVILLADSSKFHTRGLFLTCPLGKVHQLITDEGLSAKDKTMVREAGLVLTIASLE